MTETAAVTEAVTEATAEVSPEAVPAPGSAQPEVASLRQAFESGDYPYETRLSRRSYEAQKARLQAELLKVQLWAQETGQKFVLIFEGRDAAGKGGTIKRFTEHLNPRAARSCARHPSWSGCWCARASGFSNTGSRSRRASSAPALPAARPIRSNNGS
jgi:polyphosphate kinase 2 (PPK2 family)